MSITEDRIEKAQQALSMVYTVFQPLEELRREDGAPPACNSSTCGLGLATLDLTCLRQVRKCANRYKKMQPIEVAIPGH